MLMLLLCSLAAPVPCAGESYQSPAEGIVKMDFADDRLTLETRNASLEKVLQQLSRLAGVNIVTDGPLAETVTVYVSDLPTDEAARKILRGQDVSFVYRASGKAASADDYQLREIRIYVPEGGGGQGAKAAQPGRSPAVAAGPAASPDRRASRPEMPPPPAARSLPDRTPRDYAPHPADDFMSGLLGGNLNALDDLADQLRQEHPEAAPQINQFMKTLEEAKARAAEAGMDPSSIEDLGGMNALMRDMLRKRREGR